MRVVVAILAVFLFVSNIYAKESMLSVTDSQAMVDAKDNQKADDSLEGLSDPEYNLKNWDVRQEEVVSNALRVFKAKATPSNPYRVWIFEKNGDKNYVVAYTPTANNPKVVFTPDETFAFFVGVSSVGESVVYGLNLSNQQQYPIVSANNFDLGTCPNNQKNYIIVQREDGNQSVYYIYTPQGQEISSLTEMPPSEEILRKACY